MSKWHTFILLKGLLKTRQTVREKDIADRLVLQAVLDKLNE
jgi:hypothetical protein